jgi:hypothetical protein
MDTVNGNCYLNFKTFEYVIETENNLISFRELSLLS